MKLYSVLLSAAFVLSLLMLAPASAEGAVIDTIYCDGGLDLATGPAIAEWSALNQATDATSNSVVSDGISVGSYWMPNNYRLIQRSVLKFTMPSLTGYTSLTAGTLSLYVDSITGSSGYSIMLYVPTNAANQAELSNADYALTNVGAAASDSVAVSTVGWKTLTLNSAGLTYLYGKAGASAPLYLMITNDKDGVAPTGLGVGNSFGIRGYAEEYEPELDLEGVLTGADVVKVWDGGGVDNLASTAANWVGNVAPTENNCVLFDATSSKACTWDITSKITNFTMDGYSGTVTQASTADITINENFVLKSGTFTGSWSRWVVLDSAVFTHTGGTLSASMQIKSYGTSASYTTSIIGSLWIVDGSVFTKHSGGIVSTKLLVDSGGELVLDGYTNFRAYASSTYANSGVISGASTLDFMLYDASTSYSYGVIECPVMFELLSAASASRTANIGADTVFGSSVTIRSSHGTYTITVSTGAYDITAASLAIEARSILAQTSGAVVLSSGYSQSGVSSVYQGGALTVGDDLSLVEGTFVQGGDVVVGDDMTISSTFDSLTWSSSYELYVAGDFNVAYNGGTAYELVLVMQSGGRIVGWPNGWPAQSIDFHANTYIMEGVQVTTTGFTMSDPAYLMYINGYLTVLGLSTETTTFFDNDGVVQGSGTINITLASASKSAAMGRINIDVIVSLGAQSNRTLTVTGLVGTSDVEVRSGVSSYYVTMSFEAGDVYATELHAMNYGIINGGADIHANIIVDGGAYYEYVTDGDVVVISGIYVLGWTANQAFSEFVTIVPDWSNVDTVGSLGIRTLVEIVLIVLPAVVLGFILGPIGVVVGLAVMSSIMFFAGSVGLGVFLPTLMATIIYFIRGRQ